MAKRKIGRSESNRTTTYAEKLIEITEKHLEVISKNP